MKISIFLQVAAATNFVSIWQTLGEIINMPYTKSSGWVLKMRGTFLQRRNTAVMRETPLESTVERRFPPKIMENRNAVLLLIKAAGGIQAATVPT